MLQPLSRLKVDTLHGVASKLVIAARLMQHEEGATQPFVASAVRELADMWLSWLWNGLYARWRHQAPLAKR